MSAKIILVVLSLVVLVVIALVVLSTEGVIKLPFDPVRLDPPLPGPGSTDSTRTVSTLTSIKTALLTNWKFTIAASVVLVVLLVLAIILPIILQASKPNFIDEESTAAELDTEAQTEESFWSMKRVFAVLILAMVAVAIGLFIAESRQTLESKKEQKQPTPQPWNNFAGAHENLTV